MKGGYIMDYNAVCEISRLLGNQEELQLSFSQMLESFQEVLNKQYVQKIHSAARAEHDIVTSHPPREVTLLRALQAFTDEGGKSCLNQAINSVFFLQTLRHINESVSNISQNQEQCLQTMSNEGSNGDAPPILRENPQLAGLLLSLSLLQQK